MMPAHRIVRAPARALAEVNLFLHPGTDDVIGDRHGRWRSEAVGMLAQEHGCDLLALEPTGVVQFGTVDDDLARACLGVAADHHGGGKGPRLRGEVAHAPANNPGLLARFAPHGVFDRLPRLDKAGEARPHAWLKAIRTAEHAALAGHRQHDHDRIRARKMLRPAYRAI